MIDDSMKMQRKKSTEKGPFFQKQGFLSNKCGVCALNNLLGYKNFSSQDLNAICQKLSDSFINPYKSIFGGDFDVSVLIYALNFLNFDVKWLKNSQSVKGQIDSKYFKGFLLNRIIIKNSILTKFLDISGRHWTSVRPQGENFLLLDSRKEKYQTFESKQDISNILEQMRETGVIILSVFQQKYQIEQNECIKNIQKTKTEIQQSYRDIPQNDVKKQ